MNKYRRAESKAVKALVRLYNCYGYNLTYKPVRRKVRKMHRMIETIRKGAIAGTIPVSHELTRLLTTKRDQYDINKLITKTGWYSARRAGGIYLIDDKET